MGTSEQGHADAVQIAGQKGKLPEAASPELALALQLPAQALLATSRHRKKRQQHSKKKKRFGPHRVGMPESWFPNR